ncbi:hypothetical protein ACFRIC_01720 [Streptomyces sp. NPDC056738]|uniref:hypothetical protein n=1 Tax=Streptomyces sp. NPDC056738 TaxID=3345933 RepID=UPI003692D8A1
MPTTESRVRERWFCAWCYAWTELGTAPGLISRSWYETVDMRWEWADMPGPPVGVSHAYGYFGTTLCGMEQEGIVPSPYPWFPDWDEACSGCREAAVVIDGRWPVDDRGEKRERIRPVPPLGADWPPF